MTIVFGLGDEFIETAMANEKKVNIAIAPAEGLMLNRVGYDNYNDKLINRDMDRPQIEPWKGVEDEIEKYRVDLVDFISKTEANE